DDSVFENVNTVRAQIKELKEIDNKAPFKEEDIESLYILAEEVGKLAADYGNFVEDDPVRLNVVENSLAEIDRLKNKYNKSVAEILEHAQEIQREIDLSDNFNLRIEELKNELTIETGNLIELALQLDNQRKETAVKFSNKLRKALSSMSMGKMDFISRFSESDNSIRMSYNGKEYSVSDNGLSQAEFLISPNPGEGLKPLRKIASGGEISRLMLAIKTAIAEKDNINLLIFDEVDTGIGGEIAVKVGKLLKELAKSHQIICITHLQQIASLSDMHFAVAKKTSRGRTHAFVKHLKGKDRIAEIARLISGDPSSETSLKFARKLLSESESN
ncbi:MAG: DNA repair protein RecN, partial [candidate division Zixibacteria bacterium]|nr:DNA repair protein RecN [candidate division Zixibacteria bacterium]